MEFSLDVNRVNICWVFPEDLKLYERESTKLFGLKWFAIGNGRRWCFDLNMNLLFSKRCVLFASRIFKSLKIAVTFTLLKGAKVIILTARFKVSCNSWRTPTQAFPQVKIPYRTYEWIRAWYISIRVLIPTEWRNFARAQQALEILPDSGYVWHSLSFLLYFSTGDEQRLHCISDIIPT